MNDIEYLIDWLSSSDTGTASPVNLGDGAHQIQWNDRGYKCSVTVFPPGPDTEEIKAMSKHMNEVVWLGNIRFTRTYTPTP